MKHRARASWIAALVLYAVTGVNGEGQRVRMKVNTQVAYAPLTLWIYVATERRPENRVLRVIAESDEFFRSSEVQLDERVAPANTFTFRELPAGVYLVEARVLDSLRKTVGKEQVYVTVW